MHRSPLTAALATKDRDDRRDLLATLSADILEMAPPNPLRRDAEDLLTALLAIFLYQTETGEAERYADYDDRGMPPTLATFWRWLETKHRLATHDDLDRQAFYKQMALIAQGDLEDAASTSILLRCQNNTPAASHRIYQTMADALSIYLNTASESALDEALEGEALEDEALEDEDRISNPHAKSTKERRSLGKSMSSHQIGIFATCGFVLASALAAGLFLISPTSADRPLRPQALRLDIHKAATSEISRPRPSELLLPPATIAVNPGQPVASDDPMTAPVPSGPVLSVPTMSSAARMAPPPKAPPPPAEMSTYDIGIGAEEPVHLVIPDDARIVVSAPSQGERCLTVEYAKTSEDGTLPNFRLCRRVN